MVRAKSFLAFLAVLAISSSVASAQATPGPEHEVLKQNVGTWDCVIKMATGGPESKGVATNKLEMGGLWVLSDFKGDFGGFPFQGHGIDGYDPDKQKYVSVWVDSMTSAPMTLEGDYDAETKTLTMEGKGKTPEGISTFRNATQFKDKDHMTFTMSMVGEDGNAIPMMTIEYTRKK